MTRLEQLTAQIRRDEAVRRRVRAELDELEGWYREDGYSARTARRKAHESHPYTQCLLWRLARKERSRGLDY